jgi:hypothetical protein
MTRLLAVVLLVAALAGCVADDAQQQAVSGDEGVQATGRLEGRRIAISSGAPTVVYGDCDPNDGADVDLCMRVRTIDGVRINIVIENPSALTPGERLPVRADACDLDCDDIRTHAVVDIRIDDLQRRASGGSLDVSRVADRVAADIDLRFDDGDRITGQFDVAVGGAAPQPPPTDASS